MDPATFKDICNNWRKYIWSTIFLFFSFFVNGILNCKNYYKFFFFSKNYFALFSFKYFVSYLRNIIWLKKVNFLEWLFLMFHYSICILFEIFIRLKLERMISFKIFRNFFSFQILSFLEAFKKYRLDFCNFSFPFFRELKVREGRGYLKVGARASNPICPNWLFGYTERPD